MFQPRREPRRLKLQSLNPSPNSWQRIDSFIGSRAMSLKLNRRSVLRGMLGGGAVYMGLPALDAFLNGNGTAFANGAKLPVRFGTYFWGLGLTDTPTGGSRWVPTKVGLGYEITP